jgi:hypothetical protein
MTDKEITFDECMLDAIEAIKDAMGRLDVGYGLWPPCHSKRYNNFRDKKEGGSLSQSLKRLQGLASAHRLGDVKNINT